MSTAISNYNLREKARRFITKDPVDLILWPLIEDALITANREITDIDTVPLAWMRERYNELFTRAYADISAITKADPCVVTAASSDTDVTGHGFSSDDIVIIKGVGGMEELNTRTFRVTKIDATTLSLAQVNDQNAVDSSDYETYTGDGQLYHVGVKLPSAIEPSSGTDYKWTIKGIYAVTFNSYPATPLSEENTNTHFTIGRPDQWRYQRYGYSTLHTSTEHYLMFNKPSDIRYNIDLYIEKTYPDLATFTEAVYPPHPPEIHDCIWHRALANLTANSERQKGDGSLEVLYGQIWQQKKLEDEGFIKNFSRNLLGGQPAQGLNVKFNNPRS